MELSRRNVAKGAAWAMPSIAIASAAPALAVSTPPDEAGLQGWVFWDRDCFSSPNRVTITPSPTGSASELYPQGKYGFYVLNTTSAHVQNACMTFSYPSSLGTLTWRADSRNDGSWSTPVKVAAAKSGVTTYQTCYSGGWKDVAAQGGTPAYTAVKSYPYFSAATSRDICSTTSPIAVDILRTVTVDGTVIPLTRSITF